MPENAGQSMPHGSALEAFRRNSYREEMVRVAIQNGARAGDRIRIQHPFGTLPAEDVQITQESIDIMRAEARLASEMADSELAMIRQIFAEENLGSAEPVVRMLQAGEAYTDELRRYRREAQQRCEEHRRSSECPVEERSSLPTRLTREVTFDYARYLNPYDQVHLAVDTEGASVSPELYAYAIRDAAQRRFVERQQSRITPEVGNAPISDLSDPVGETPDRLVVARVAPHVTGAPINWGEIAPTPPPDEPQAADDLRGNAYVERRPIQRERLAAHDSRDRMRERTGEERVRAYALANRLKDGNIE